MFASCVITVAAGLSPTCRAQSPASQEAPAPRNDPHNAGNSAADTTTKLPDPDPGPGDYNNALGMSVVKHIIKDQEAIWTSPARIRAQDSIWLVPLGGLAAGLIATDRDVSLHISNTPKTQNRYVSFSNYGIAALAGGTGALYLWGHFTHNDHAREAGLLAGEAAVDS